VVGEQRSGRQVILVGVCALATVVLSASGCSSDGRSGDAAAAEPARPMASVTAAIEVRSDVTVPVTVHTSKTSAAVAQAPVPTSAATTAEARPATVPPGLAFESRLVETPEGLYVKIDTLPAPPPRTASWVMDIELGPTHVVPAVPGASLRVPAEGFGPPGTQVNRIWYTLTASSSSGDILASGTDIFELPRNR